TIKKKAPTTTNTESAIVAIRPVATPATSKDGLDINGNKTSAFPEEACTFHDSMPTIGTSHQLRGSPNPDGTIFFPTPSSPTAMLLPDGRKSKSVRSSPRSTAATDTTPGVSDARVCSSNGR